MNKEIEEYKQEFASAFCALPESRQKEIADFYGRSVAGVAIQIIRDSKREAQSVMDYADRHCYGYGEVGYNINEHIKDFAEDVPELEKQYRRLIKSYFELLTEAKEA